MLTRCSTGAAPSFGPVIAGVLAQKLGWRWIFWFLVTLTGTYLVVVVLWLPETQRKVVGNGSLPARGIHRSLFDVFTKGRRTAISKQEDDKERTRKRARFHFPNPFKCIPMLFKKGNLTVIMIGSITYTVKMTLQTSLAAQCIDIYQLNYLQAGLIYLPSGIGGALAAYSTGRLDVDIDVRYLANRGALQASFSTGTSRRSPPDADETEDTVGEMTFPISPLKTQGSLASILSPPSAPQEPWPTASVLRSER